MQVRQLQLHDRAVLAGSKLLVGSRMARVFVAVYAGLLHLFIMVRGERVGRIESGGGVCGRNSPQGRDGDVEVIF